MQTEGAPYRKSTGIKGSFDVAVIGSGMGGLSAASLLAQNGRRVLVLEQHNVIGGLTQSYTRNGYRWTVGLHYIGDVGSPATTTWKLFDKVTGGAVQWAPLPAIYNRMVIGGRRYDIPAGAALSSWRIRVVSLRIVGSSAPWSKRTNLERATAASASS